ncbi:hypothetical protein CUJ87_32580 (plasmid) [Paraburkholderia caledonica]|nr:hypothetical protein CUJ87_32580 [Paraburkholderia caledonica]
MIDRTHALPVSQQARLVGIARSSVYYRAQPASEADRVLMRRIDELHMEFPFAGARMLARLLRREGREIGRRRVRTLMKRMGIEALYCNPHQIPHVGEKLNCQIDRLMVARSDNYPAWRTAD